MTTLSDRWEPKSRADVDCANALREYETAHKVWMATPVHTTWARVAMDAARERYVAAYKAAYPTHIVM